MISRLLVRTQLLDNLMNQITSLEETIKSQYEIISCIDDGSMTIGEKRNLMVSNANGKYVCFIDDDDIISDKYLSSFVDMIGKDFDCSDLKGIYYNGSIKKPFYHSVQISDWSETKDSYLRCPNHLNMIRKDIVKKVPFKSIRNAEDKDFSIRLRDSKLLQNEFKTNEILYHYVDGIKNIRNKVSFKNLPLEIVQSPWSYKFIKDAKILVKLPSRERPAKLKSTLQLYVSKSEKKNNVYYMITLDENDPSATKEFVQSLKNIHPNINIMLGQSTSKISACNRDMTPEIVANYDIFILASDDMIPKIQGWDIKISDTMNSVFPCYDGVLHFNDGFTGQKLNTMCILGREYYKLFNYFYHPDYKSLWCDNEFTDMSINRKKCYYENTVLFKHEHPANLNVSQDALYKRNDEFYSQDKITYERRKNERIFDLNEIPIIINNRNLLTWPQKMVAKLRTLNLVKSIYILDNQSTYGPLLEWYDQLQHDPIVKVIRLDKNVGHTAPWKCSELNHLLNTLYVVTDPDLNIDNLPSNILEILSSKLKKSNFQKIGLKLQTGPTFNNKSIVYQHIQDWEVKRWAKCSIQDEVANIDIDTTFALYKSSNYFIGGGSYIHNSVVHEPWSFSLESLQQNKEFLYYIYTSNKSCSFQTFLTKFAPNLEKKIFDTTAYSNYYPDLKNAFRYDSEKLFQHWKSYGHSENRKFFLN
jgi:hypothetical protein